MQWPRCSGWEWSWVYFHYFLAITYFVEVANVAKSITFSDCQHDYRPQLSTRFRFASGPPRGWGICSQSTHWNMKFPIELVNHPKKWTSWNVFFCLFDIQLFPDPFWIILKNLGRVPKNIYESTRTAGNILGPRVDLDVGPNVFTKHIYPTLARFASFVDLWSRIYAACCMSSECRLKQQAHRMSHPPRSLSRWSRPSEGVCTGAPFGLSFVTLFGWRIRDLHLGFPLWNSTTGRCNKKDETRHSCKKPRFLR